MEYIFGYEPRYGEVLKVKDPSNVDLPEGQHIKEREYSDQIITDGFYVGKRIRSKEDSAGNKYAWYMISNHYRYTDKFTPGIKSTEQEITDLEIDGMEKDQTITDLEIEGMEQEQSITDLEIEVMEIQEIINPQ